MDNVIYLLARVSQGYTSLRGGYDTPLRREREGISQPCGHTQNTLRAFAKHLTGVRKII